MPGRARGRTEGTASQRSQRPRAQLREHGSSAQRSAAPLLCRLVRLRPGDDRRPRRRALLGGRRAQARLADERALPGRPDAGDLHCRAVAALAAVTAEDRGVSARLAGLELGVATINRCIHEFGRASEPVVEDLIEEVRAAGLVHLDETPWYQRGALLWLWVAVTASTVIYRIGSRRKQDLVALVGAAFLGWMVTDGYTAYRHHPRRQRCLAHLIRKALALAEGYYGPGSAFGRDLVRDLRRLIERVRDGDNDEGAKRLLARIKWTCQCNQYEVEEKVRALAREILNDWEAVIAFVANPLLPPTNNDAERALRHAVIARRITFGTRTDEGSRFYAAGLSVIDTCRKRGVDPWTYARDLIAAARKGSSLPSIPVKLAA